MDDDDVTWELLHAHCFSGQQRAAANDCPVCHSYTDTPASLCIVCRALAFGLAYACLFPLCVCVVGPSRGLWTWLGMTTATVNVARLPLPPPSALPCPRHNYNTLPEHCCTSSPRACRFRLGRQEDAHEYLRCVLDAMHEAFLKHIQPKPPPELAATTFIHRIFGGKLRSEVRPHVPCCFDPAPSQPQPCGLLPGACCPCSTAAAGFSITSFHWLCMRQKHSASGTCSCGVFRPLSCQPSP